MRQVSDEFLLNVAVIAATLLGLLVVGVLFYVETGLHRMDRMRESFAPYLRAAAKLTMSLYVMALAVSLTLVILEPPWSRTVFALTGLGALLSLIGYTNRGRTLGQIAGSVLWSLPQEVFTWTFFAAVLFMPWILGGLRPGRGELTWGVLLALASGLLSTLNILLSIFDVAKFERAVRSTDD
jgi:hypothetical protein